MKGRETMEDWGWTMIGGIDVRKLPKPELPEDLKKIKEEILKEQAEWERHFPSRIFSCESLEDALMEMGEMLLEEILEDEEFSAEYPNPIWSEMRIDFLTIKDTEEETEEMFERLLEDRFSGAIQKHLKEMQDRCVQFCQIERERMMKSRGLTEEMKKQNPEEYKSEMEEISRTVRDMAARMIVPEPY